MSDTHPPSTTNGAAAGRDSPPRAFWKYLRGLAPPVLVLLVLVAGLAYALLSRLESQRAADEATLHEWLDEALVPGSGKTLPERIREYVQSGDPKKADEIYRHIKAICEPTKMHAGYFPGFLTVYRFEVHVPDSDKKLAPVEWNSGLPRPKRVTGDMEDYEVLKLVHPIRDGGGASIYLEYQLHAYNQRQQIEAQRRGLFLGVIVLAVAAATLATMWVYFFVKREREQEHQRAVVQQQVDLAERRSLENELHRQEAERQREDVERKLLEQRLATQDAEQQALELKSQLYASIGIMAGSYAHNIKNLLVRPNDLLRRCIEGAGLKPEQTHMLQEVQTTLHTVTERLQQILKTVRRDPTRSELSKLDLNDVAREIHQHWHDMALQKWKLALSAELTPTALPIAGDLSHVMQAVENLVFNARDATFEMRNQVREQARKNPSLGDEGKRRALMAAASWKGLVTVRTSSQDGFAVLEVSDNGIGMSEDVRRRCVETHFSTKRDNAVHEGNSAGMGLGLSFVQAILEHHKAKMEIVSEPMKGATFRLYFPLAAQPAATPQPA